MLVLEVVTYALDALLAHEGPLPAPRAQLAAALAHAHSLCQRHDRLPGFSRGYTSAAWGSAHLCGERPAHVPLGVAVEDLVGRGELVVTERLDVDCVAQESQRFVVFPDDRLRDHTSGLNLAFAE